MSEQVSKILSEEDWARFKLGDQEAFESMRFYENKASERNKIEH